MKEFNDKNKWKEIGKRMQETRKKLGYTQGQICDKMQIKGIMTKSPDSDLSPEMLSRIENGHRMPDYVLDIIDYLHEESGIRREYLFAEDDFKTLDDIRYIQEKKNFAEFEKQEKLLSFLETLDLRIECCVFAYRIPITKTIYDSYKDSLTDNANKAFKQCLRIQNCDYSNLARNYPDDFLCEDYGAFYAFRLKNLPLFPLTKRNPTDLPDYSSFAMLYRVSYNNIHFSKWQDNPCFDLLNNIKAVCKALIDNFDFEYAKKYL